MGTKETYAEMKQLAKLLLSGGMALSSDAVEKLASLYQEYIDELPEEHKNVDVIIIAQGRTYSFKRTEIPKLIRENAEVRDMFLKRLAGV